MFNRKKSGSFSQGKYFTIMLVPSFSSGKTRSIKITKGFILFSFIFTSALIISIFGIFYLRDTYLNKIVKNIKYDLEQSRTDYESMEQAAKDEYARLEEQSEKLKDLFDQEKNNNKNLTDIQNEEYAKKLDYYEQKTNEIISKLQDLIKSKEEIFKQLKVLKHLPEINAAIFDVSGGFNNSLLNGGVAESENSPSSFDKRLNDIYSILEIELNEQIIYYAKITDETKRIKPYIDNYPTILPVEGIITSGFGERSNVFGGNGSENHTGIDIAVPVGSAVYACGGGYVTFSGSKNGYGNIVVINHDMGIETYYAHNSQLVVSEGDVVKRGDLIALSGNTGRSTGPHVHYEVVINGESVNPNELYEGLVLID